ncbi:hypothetical protein BURKHO8Y_170427 [Burkholderia sp. 8Y]|nr:hypothetical protein BURKHO8Y_170427 [Burkholderia sp. 8Y]
MRTFHLDVDAVGQRIEDAGERRAHIAREADGGDFGRRVGELRLRAQHEHRQALLDRRLNVLRDQQTHGVRCTPHQERAEQPALRRAIAREARGGGIEMLDVVGELVMQEGDGVFALHVDHAELRERHVDARASEGFEIGGGEGTGLGIHKDDGSMLGTRPVHPAPRRWASHYIDVGRGVFLRGRRDGGCARFRFVGECGFRGMRRSFLSTTPAPRDGYRYVGEVLVRDAQRGERGGWRGLKGRVKPSRDAPLLSCTTTPAPRPSLRRARRLFAAIDGKNGSTGA